MKPYLCILCLAFCLTNVQAESENQLFKIDVLKFVNNGDAILTATEWDIGHVNNCFDGDTTSIMRSANINPAFVQIEFTEKQTANVVRVLLGEPGYPNIDKNDWWVEIADTQSDLDSQTGTYQLIVPRRYDVAGAWDEATIPSQTSARIWKFNIERTVGDNYVHIPELELWRETVKVDTLILVPFGTTVLLQWEEDTSGTVAAYNIYRSEISNQFGEPVRYVGPKPFYTDYNLQPGTQYFYKIAALDKYGNEFSLSEEVAATTSQNVSQYLKIANLDLLIPIYTGDMSPGEAMRIQKAMELARAFYFRNSRGQLNLNCTYMLIDAIAPSTQGPTYTNVEADLRSRGVRDNQYDAVHTFANNLAGCYGGFILLGNTGGSFGRVCGVPFPDNDPNVDYTAAWSFTHEFGHVLDLVIADRSGFPEMLFNHFPWAFPLPEGIEKFDAGQHFDGMAGVLRIFEHHLDYAAPWDGYIEVVDQDHDGLADSDFRVPMDEARFSSSSGMADTDGDNLTDLDEFIAGIYSSSDPRNPDTDADGLNDGEDIYPITNFAPKIPRSGDVVLINGVLSESEKWHLLVSNPYFSTIPNLELSMYATWDDDYLYFAFQSNQQLKLYLGLDASGQDGVWTCPIKFPSGDYSSGNQGINENSFGDTYNEDAYLVFRYDSTKVFLKNKVLSGSSSSSRFEDGIYTIESRIPHNIGPGRGWHYVAPDAPIIQEQRFGEGDTLGFELLARPLQGSNGTDPYDWNYGNEWASMFELYHFYDATLVTDIGTVVADNSQEIPSDYTLWQNYPNPFNPSTSISYQLPAVGFVNLTIYNALGEQVRTLVNAKQSIGKYQVQWNGRDDYGALVSSGTYFYTLKVGEYTLMSKPMTLIK